MNPRFKLETETKVKSAALSLIDQFTAFEVEFVIEAFANTARALAQEERDKVSGGNYGRYDSVSFEDKLGEDFFRRING